MSLDIGLAKMQMAEVYSANYTHNVTHMWRLAGVYDALYNSEGKKAEEILLELERGLNAMKAEPEKYRALNPVNGWGKYESAVEFLEKFLQACYENSSAVITVSK